MAHYHGQNIEQARLSRATLEFSFKVSFDTEINRSEGARSGWGGAPLPDLETLTGGSNTVNDKIVKTRVPCQALSAKRLTITLQFI